MTEPSIRILRPEPQIWTHGCNAPLPTGELERRIAAHRERIERECPGTIDRRLTHVPLVEWRQRLAVYLLRHGPARSETIRRDLGIGTTAFSRATARHPWFSRSYGSRGSWRITDSGIEAVTGSPAQKGVGKCAMKSASTTGS